MRKSGKKNSGDSQFNAVITEELHRRVSQVRAVLGITQADVCTQALNMWLKKHSSKIK